MKKWSKKKTYLSILIVFIILIILKVSFSYLTDRSTQSSIDQSSVTPNYLENRSQDLTLSQAVLYTSSFNSNTFLESKGNVEILRIENDYYVSINKDFSVPAIPDLYLYLSEVQNSDTIDTSKTLNIGKLRNINGSQVYKISEEQYKKYNGGIMIWNKLFAMPIATATFN